MKRKKTAHVARTGDMGLVRVFLARRSATLGLASLTEESGIGHGISRRENLGLWHWVRVAHVGCGMGDEWRGEARKEGGSDDPSRLTLDCGQRIRILGL